MPATGACHALVPHYAMSGGTMTMIALAADQFLLAPCAVLGPVDPQLGDYPAASIVAAAERKPEADVNDRTLLLAYIATKTLDQAQMKYRSTSAMVPGPKKVSRPATKSAMPSINGQPMLLKSKVRPRSSAARLLRL